MMIRAGCLWVIFLYNIIPIFLEPFCYFRIQIYYRRGLNYMFFRWHCAAYGRIPVNFNEISTGFLPSIHDSYCCIIIQVIIRFRMIKLWRYYSILFIYYARNRRFSHSVFDTQCLLRFIERQTQYNIWY